MTNKLFFGFEHKISWSDVISAAALLLAILALVDTRRASRPAVSIEHFPIALGPVPDLASQAYKFAAVLPVVFSNSGGRATTLLTLRRTEGIEPVLFGLGPELLVGAGPSYELFLSERMIASVVEWKAEGPKRTRLNPTVPPLINVSIPSGESRVIYLGVLVDAYDGLARRADRLLYAVEAEFSDGTRRPIRGAVNVGPLLAGGDAYPVSPNAPGTTTPSNQALQRTAPVSPERRR